jgi:hypothetical protein
MTITLANIDIIIELKLACKNRNKMLYSSKLFRSNHSLPAESLCHPALGQR